MLSLNLACTASFINEKKAGYFMLILIFPGKQILPHKIIFFECTSKIKVILY